MLDNLWALHPPVGVWIGVLGLLGVLVPLIRDINKMGRNEKALWTGVMFLMLLLELKTLYQDRNEHDRQQAQARAEQLEQFGRIAQGISGNLETSEREFKATTEQSQNHFSATMQKSEKIVHSVADSIKNQTGGNSFAYITFIAQPPNIHVTPVPAAKGPWYLVYITTHGKYPLRDVRATLMDDERRTAAVIEYNKHPTGDVLNTINSADTVFQIPYLRPQSPEGPSGDVEFLGVYPISEGTPKRMSINFSSLNGYWNETLHLGLVNGAWHQCLVVTGPTQPQFTNPFLYCDSEWPEGKKLAEQDWPRLNKRSRKQ